MIHFFVISDTSRHGSLFTDQFLNVKVIQIELYLKVKVFPKNIYAIKVVLSDTSASIKSVVGVRGGEVTRDRGCAGPTGLSVAAAMIWCGYVRIHYESTRKLIVVSFYTNFHIF